MQPSFSGNGGGQDTPLTPRMRLRTSDHWNVVARVAPPAATLGTPQAGITAPLSLFTPAEPPIVLDVQRAPAAVLGASSQPATLALQYTPADEAAYVLLQEIQTPDGMIYDFTLPHLAAPAAATLGGAPPSLTFPVTPLLGAERPPTAALGWEDVAQGLVGDFVTRRVLQVLQSPFDRALLGLVRRSEPTPRMLVQRDTLQPLDGFDAWRALLPPGREHRALLFIHGFGSNAERGGFAQLMPHFRASYDTLLCYEHPTISLTPLENARDLLAHIPDDLRLSVDIIAHSRGGLVARSLIELLDPQATCVPRRFVSHGTPHAGTRLADPERWDRLISIGMTAASWLAASGGVTVWLPQALELVLKAAAQSIFALPGIAAMQRDGPFLRDLNAVADSTTSAGAFQRGVQYAAVCSTFSIFNGPRPALQQALRAMATQAFMDEANDLVVPTSSMSAIDTAAQILAPERQIKVDVDHFSYFRNPQVIDFLHQQLAS